MIGLFKDRVSFRSVASKTICSNASPSKIHSTDFVAPTLSMKLTVAAPNFSISNNVSSWLNYSCDIFCLGFLLHWFFLLCNGCMSYLLYIQQFHCSVDSLEFIELYFKGHGFRVVISPCLVFAMSWLISWILRPPPCENLSSQVLSCALWNSSFKDFSTQDIITVL